MANSKWLIADSQTFAICYQPFAKIAGRRFELLTFGLCVPLQLSLPDQSVCGLDFLFTHSDNRYWGACH
jgi:hypothetical protein